jgi:hypothetical protein
VAAVGSDQTGRVARPIHLTHMNDPLKTQVAGTHYKHLAIQPAEYCQLNRLPYCESSVIRYVTRHREKNGRQDIEKAIHCLQLLLELEYPETK